MLRGQTFQQLCLDCHTLSMHDQLRGYQFYPCSPHFNDRGMKDIRKCAAVSFSGAVTVSELGWPLIYVSRVIATARRTCGFRGGEFRTFDLLQGVTVLDQSRREMW